MDSTTYSSPSGHVSFTIVHGDDDTHIVGKDETEKEIVKVSTADNSQTLQTKIDEAVQEQANSSATQYHSLINVSKQSYPDTILGQMKRKNDLLNNANVYKEFNTIVQTMETKVNVAYKHSMAHIAQQKNNIDLLNLLKHNENVEIKKEDYLFNSLGFKYKTDEHGNFIRDTNGDLVKEPLIDSSGQRVTPRVSKALNNAEYANAKSIENQTDYTELLNLKDEIETNDSLLETEENNILTEVLKQFESLDITKIENYDNNKEL